MGVAAGMAAGTALGAAGGSAANGGQETASFGRGMGAPGSLGGSADDPGFSMGKVLRRGGNGTGRIYHDYNNEIAQLDEGMKNFDSMITEWAQEINQDMERVSNDPSLTNEQKRSELERLKKTLEFLPGYRQQTYEAYAAERSRLLSLAGSDDSNENVSLGEPRSLDATQQEFHTQPDGSEVYNSPLETEKDLCPKQGNARVMFKGTCGLCSCANILRLAGVDYREGDMIDYAAGEHLCATGSRNVGRNGGTTPASRQAILEHFGIKSSIVPLDQPTGDSDAFPESNIDKIAQCVSQGRGVIISVHADSLWHNNPKPANDLHAVTIVSVRKVGGRVVGFYINDTGMGGTYYYPAGKVLEALSGAPMNVTDTIIR